MRRLFRNGKILAEEGVVEYGHVLTEGGLISAVGEGPFPGSLDGIEVCNLKGQWLSPGFIDSHVHGGGGSDFMDGTVEAVAAAARLHLAHGTTTICPTSLACGDEDLFAFFDAFEKARGLMGVSGGRQHPPELKKNNMPHLHGIHLEGPYFSPAQAGAQPPEYMRKPFPDHFLKVLERSGGHIVRWSSAPEVEGVLELGDECVSRGIMPSIAHTDADYALIRRAMEHGYRHLTHFYSGMSMLRRQNGYRILGAVEAGYLLDDLHVELIADGIHLPPELLRLILKCKDHGHISLVTDAMRAAGMPEGPSILGSLKEGHEVIVEGGIARMPDRQSFAGSVATMDRLVRVMTQEAGLSVREAVQMASQNLAKLLGIFGKTGSLAPGQAADMVVFDDAIQISRVFVNGEPFDLSPENK